MIADKVIGKKYINLIQSLGLEYSPSKTHISDNFYEFAKRVFIDQVEVSPFPISALSECSKSPEMMTTLLWELKRKGRWLPKVDIVSSIQDFFILVQN